MGRTKAASPIGCREKGDCQGKIGAFTESVNVLVAVQPHTRVLVE